MSEKFLYCIGEGDTWDLPEFNFISMCSIKKKLNNPLRTKRENSNRSESPNNTDSSDCPH